MSLRIGIGNILIQSTTPSPGSWTAQYYTVKSGSIWYRREINNALGYFYLDYSDDAGVTWENLATLDLTEDSVLIDLTHQYVHSIVGTSYHVDTTLGENLYST